MVMAYDDNEESGLQDADTKRILQALKRSPTPDDNLGEVSPVLPEGESPISTPNHFGTGEDHPFRKN